MEHIQINETYPSATETAVTLGKFDGIHRGHRRLVENVLLRKEFGETAVLFAVDASTNLILTRKERAVLLERMGIDLLLEKKLDERFRSTRAEDFIKEILVGDLGVSYVTVGEDFRFGYERKGTPELLVKMGEKLGFAVEVVPREMDGRRKISSTFIREELRLGNMEKVAQLMGTPYFLIGTIRHGEGLGHIRLFPTANIVPEPEKLLPPNGVYCSLSQFAHKTYMGMTTIGKKPTVEGTFVGVETYLFDCNEDLYGPTCEVEILHYLRPEQRFAGLDALRSQMGKDMEAGRLFFAATVL